MTFPARRPRRLRRTPALRRLVAETQLQVDDLVAPLFVREGIDEPQPIPSLPGVVQHTRESLRKEVAELADLGVPGGHPLRRARRTRTRRQPGVGPRRHRAARAPRPARRDRRSTSSSSPTCASTSTPTTATAACSPPSGEVDNDADPRRCTRRPRSAQADGRRRHRRAERDDGRPGAARSAPRSTTRGYESTAILAYSAKYASALYGPFRDAVDVHDRRRWRSQGLPAGLAQRPRGARRGARSTSPRAPTSSW